MKNLKTLTLLAWALLAASAAGAQPDSIGPSTPFGSHPRLLLAGGEEGALMRSLEADTTWMAFHRLILRESDNLIGMPPIQRIQIGRRLLDKSREALRRIFQLSYAFRTTRGRQYLERAEREMLAIAGFSDWNPTHFLDVAEMTMAMAIGYDWLYEVLPATSRSAIRDAIIAKGLEPSLDSRYNSWLRAEHNWNQVCNAGMAYGAIAVQEDRPALAVRIINRAIASIRIPMKDYGPDGVYPEGYGYWGYGTSFNVMFLSAVEKLFGTDFGLAKAPGFLRTAEFLEHMTGPTGKPFNYSDAGPNGGFHPTMFWLANKTGDPSVLWQELDFLRRHGVKGREGDRLLPALLLWKGDIRMDGIQPPKATMWTGMGKNPVALMRSSWKDPDAVYVAMKGGSASINHAHMDIGSFVMDADGLRWAADLGMQNYESLESLGFKLFGRTQDAQRWTVFRLHNLSHNTLAVDNALQMVDGQAPIVKTGDGKDFKFAVTDLGTVYKGQLAAARRGIAIAHNSHVVVRDELEAAGKDVTVRWSMLTPAKAEITGANEATLTQEGRKLRLVVETDAPLQMKTWSTDPPNSYDAPNPGTMIVGFELKLKAGSRTAVNARLIPQRAGNPKTGKIKELSEWK